MPPAKMPPSCGAESMPFDPFVAGLLGMSLLLRARFWLAGSAGARKPGTGGAPPAGGPEEDVLLDPPTIGADRSFVTAFLSRAPFSMSPRRPACAPNVSECVLGCIAEMSALLFLWLLQVEVGRAVLQAAEGVEVVDLQSHQALGVVEGEVAVVGASCRVGAVVVCCNVEANVVPDLQMLLACIALPTFVILFSHSNAPHSICGRNSAISAKGK